MKVGVIGAGRAGGSLALALGKKSAVDAGYTLQGATTSSDLTAGAASEVLGLAVGTDNAALAREADVVVLGVPDRKIALTALHLADELGKAPAGGVAKIFLHISGSVGTPALRPLKEEGYSIGSLHPLQSFSKPEDKFDGVYMAVDGDEPALEAAENLARALGGIPFRVPPSERQLYHAAACFCSNYVVTAVSIAEKLLERWIGEGGEALTALLPLFNGTADNLAAATTAREALTGPISRGDVGTVSGHLQVLPESLIKVYCELGLQTLEIARENGTVERKPAEEIEAMLRRP
ncbi:MAG: DUF2520 domain-containing protein [Clostridiales Family XIII bacterium]|jgi:predicted short-subunit dehydrogenase-like oxidoreductase (DUF2520 family)|nr:DUF2520 domain-containing protein [Clostridiales Family XIII bacterium]